MIMRIKEDISRGYLEMVWYQIKGGRGEEEEGGKKGEEEGEKKVGIDKLIERIKWRRKIASTDKDRC